MVLAVDHTPSYSIAYPDAVEMRFDPVNLAGTYEGGDSINETPTFSGSGVNGVWFGVAAAPFHESFKRPQWSS